MRDAANDLESFGKCLTIARASFKDARWRVRGEHRDVDSIIGVTLALTFLVGRVETKMR